MTPANFLALSAVANVGTPVSAAFDGRFVRYATVQASFSDVAAAGSLVLQGSNDPGPTLTNWTAIPASAFAVTAGGVQLTPVALICHQFIRVAFARTAGAGTITANLHTLGE